MLCVASSPSGSLFRYPQTVQVGLLPAAASLLRWVEVVGEEGPCRVAVGGVSLSVLVRVPLIGQLVVVLKGAVLMSGCRRTERFILTVDVKKKTCLNPRTRVSVTWRSRRRPGRDILVRS